MHEPQSRNEILTYLFCRGNFNAAKYHKPTNQTFACSNFAYTAMKSSHISPSDLPPLLRSPNYFVKHCQKLWKNVESWTSSSGTSTPGSSHLLLVFYPDVEHQENDVTHITYCSTIHVVLATSLGKNLLQSTLMWFFVKGDAHSWNRQRFENSFNTFHLWQRDLQMFRDFDIWINLTYAWWCGSNSTY